VTGWVPYEKLGQADALAQIGIVALQPTGNNFGGLGNKVYSYMSCGQPAIVPKNSATAELVAQYDCGIGVDIAQPEAIAEAMVKLAHDPGLRKRLGQNGRRAVETELAWHKMEEKLGVGYARLCRLAQQRQTRAN
jgi:glycosyltransferase involved in cell wall biosynthesis